MRQYMRHSVVLIGMLTVFSVFFPGIVAADISTGLIAHFDFEQNIADSSPTGFSGVMHGNLSYSPGAVGSYAAVFDGSSYIAFPTQYLYPLCNGTINLFVNVSSDFNYDQHVMGVKTNYKTEIGFGLNPLTYAGVPITAGNWYMITVTYSNGCTSTGSEKVYLNGQFVSEEINYHNNGYIGTWAYLSNPNYSVIGQSAAHPIESPKFKGLVDDIRIYNRALSQTEIQQLYQLRNVITPVQNITRSYKSGALPTSGGGTFPYVYGRSMVDGSIIIDINIKLNNETGGQISDSILQLWESGIEQIWSNRYNLSDGTYQYPIVFRVNWIPENMSINPYIYKTVSVKSVTGLWSTGEWYPTVYPLNIQDQIVAHEVGHYFGLYDEYTGGSLDPQNPIVDATALMAGHDSINPAIKERYFSEIIRWFEAETGRTASLTPTGAIPYVFTPYPSGLYESPIIGMTRNDWNIDGTSDLLWRHTPTGNIALWYMNGTSVTSYTTIATTPTDWIIAGTGDFNNDRKPDILWRHTPSGTVALWYMNGTSIGSTDVIGLVSADWELVGTADLNGDGKPDLLWRNTSGAIACWFMDGRDFVSAAGIAYVDVNWRIAGVADFNADGKPDILWQHTPSGTVAIWYMNGTSMTSATVINRVGTDWIITGTPDLNNDGKTDILWRQVSTGLIAYWLMDGANIQSTGTITTLDPSWQIVAPK